MNLAIAGIGTAVPPHSISQVQAAEVAKLVCCRNEDEAAILPALYRHTGIESRHMVFADDAVADVLDGTSHSGCEFLPAGTGDGLGPRTGLRMTRYIAEAAPLALQAARQALDRSGLRAAEFTHLVTISCTGFSAPGMDIALINGLGLSRGIERAHIGFMGCHGAIDGLRVAHAFASTGRSARILLCAVELCSVHYFYGWDPKKLVANSLFADGAAAVVGVAEDSPTSSWQVKATGSCLFPDSEYAMTWNIGDHGFEMTLSTRVPSLIAAHLRPWLAGWLEQFGLTIGEIGSWAVHPGGPRILSAVQESLSLPRDALEVSREVLAHYGNMSSPTVLFILERLCARQAPRPCVALAFGPGLVAEAALFV
jgi:predicted naringenin-chalcone synthase